MWKHLAVFSLAVKSQKPQILWQKLKNKTKKQLEYFSLSLPNTSSLRSLISSDLLDLLILRSQDPQILRSSDPQILR